MQSSRDPGHDPDLPEAPPPLAYIAWFGLLVGWLRLPPFPLLPGGRTLTFTPKETFKGVAHLSPGISLISDLAHDSGMLQSELFTSRSQNLVLAKLPNSGFWRYGQFFK